MKEMKWYSEFINPYMEKIKNNEIEHCKEQEQMIDNIVIPVLERDDVYIDDERIRAGLELQRYFPYDLIEWEVFLFALIAGVFYKSGDIFFKVIRIIVGRGSGKNGFISFLAFYFLSPIHGVEGYNIDLLANSEKQSKVSFNDVWQVINSPRNREDKVALNHNFYCTKEIITGLLTNSQLRFETSSKRGKDSKRTGCVIYDEKHEYESAENMNTLRSGLGKVPCGREITITTDGHTRGGVFDKEKEQNKDILSEYNPENRTLVFWCRIEDEDEYKDETKWIKAIPSIDAFPELKATVKQELIDMPYNLDYLPEFMAKRMNYPIGNKDVEVAKWDDILATNREMPDLKGMECVGGIDYAKTDDFVGCVLVFPRGGQYYVIHHSFVCKKSRDLAGIKAPLKEWEARGDLEFVDDVEIPPDRIASWFAEMNMTYDIKRIAIDSFRYSLLNSALKEYGWDAWDKKNIKLVRKSDTVKIAPVINSAFVRQVIVWGDVPMMRWYTNNTKKIQMNGNIEFGKIEEHYRKTDGFMAFVSAMTITDEVKERPKVLGDRRLMTVC